jgi:hypothetical protein
LNRKLSKFAIFYFYEYLYFKGIDASLLPYIKYANKNKKNNIINTQVLMSDVLKIEMGEKPKAKIYQADIKNKQ